MLILFSVIEIRLIENMSLRNIHSVKDISLYGKLRKVQILNSNLHTVHNEWQFDWPELPGKKTHTQKTHYNYSICHEYINITTRNTKTTKRHFDKLFWPFDLTHYLYPQEHNYPEPLNLSSPMFPLRCSLYKLCLLKHYKPLASPLQSTACRVLVLKISGY